MRNKEVIETFTNQYFIGQASVSGAHPCETTRRTTQCEWVARVDHRARLARAAGMKVRDLKHNSNRSSSWSNVVEHFANVSLNLAENHFLPKNYKYSSGVLYLIRSRVTSCESGFAPSCAVERGNPRAQSRAATSAHHSK